MSFTCPLCGGALHSMNDNGIWYKECVECSYTTKPEEEAKNDRQY